MPAKRLSGPQLLTNATVTQYTVPAAARTIVRHIHISNTSAGAVTLTMSIGADAQGTRIFDGYTIASGAVLDHFCYYVLAAAQLIAAQGGTNNILTCTIDGDEDLV